MKELRSKLGLCGCHRSGKTTLAIALSEKLGIPYIPINTSEVFLQYSVHPSDTIDVHKRLFLQQKVLEKAVNIWSETKEPFICDRTPMDMMAYMFADVTNGRLDQITQDDIMGYLGQCFKITKQYFDKLVLIPPAIPFIHSEYKAADNEPLRFELHYTISGMLDALGMTYQKLPDECLDISDRVNFVEGYWRQ